MTLPDALSSLVSCGGGECRLRLPSRDIFVRLEFKQSSKGGAIN